MVQLIKCIECNGTVSEEAKSCPHCKTKHPRGLTCLRCGKACKASLADPELIIEQSFGRSQIKWCPDCMALRQSIQKELLRSTRQIKCVACQHVIGVATEGKDIASQKREIANPCPNCGHTNNHTFDMFLTKAEERSECSGPSYRRWTEYIKVECDFCGYPIFERPEEKRAKVNGRDVHRICLDRVPYLQQRLAAENERRRQEQEKRERERKQSILRTKEREWQEKTDEINAKFLSDFGGVTVVAL